MLPNDSLFMNHTNRGFKYGDALFETIRTSPTGIYYWEAHYFRLMAAMRILRMEIPMEYSMEFLAKNILDTVQANSTENQAENDTFFNVQLTVFRNADTSFSEKKNTCSFVIESEPLTSASFSYLRNSYEVTLFKDFTIQADLLSNINTNNRKINVIAEIFALENGYDDAVLLNAQKQVVGTLQGNLFLVIGNTIKTSPLTDGCINGIIRKRIIEILKKTDSYDFQEASVSPFELQKADELFISNSLHGIKPITKYRKTTYKTNVSKRLLEMLNTDAEENIF